MVLESERCTKERHDAVAHDLIDRSLVAMDGFHHSGEDGIQKSAGVFWVSVGQKLHRAFEVGEEHSHLLALTLK